MSKVSHYDLACFLSFTELSSDSPALLQCPLLQNFSPLPLGVLVPKFQICHAPIRKMTCKPLNIPSQCYRASMLERYFWCFSEWHRLQPLGIRDHCPQELFFMRISLLEKGAGVTLNSVRSLLSSVLYWGGPPNKVCVPIKVYTHTYTFIFCWVPIKVYSPDRGSQLTIGSTVKLDSVPTAPRRRRSAPGHPSRSLITVANLTFFFFLKFYFF